MAGRDEVPAAPVIAELEVRAEDAIAPGEADLRVLDVHVEDAIWEGVDELYRVEELVHEVAGVEVEAERLVIVQRLERPLSGVDVVGDLRRVAFQGEAHALAGEHVEDRLPAGGELLKAAINHGIGRGREEVEQVPDRAAGEAVNHVDAEQLGGAGRVLHFLGAALAHAFGIAVAPQARREDGLVPLVNQRVGDALANQVRADGEALQPVLLQDVPTALGVAVLRQRLVYLEVIAPAGKFQPVIAKAGGLLGHDFQGQIGPLAGEDGDWPSHNRKSFLLIRRTGTQKLCGTRRMAGHLPGPARQSAGRSAQSLRRDGLAVGGGRCFGSVRHQLAHG